MKNKRIFVTFVFVLALMLALAISSYAATITLYSGADSTSSSTTHNGSLTLTGNTEENETVTVYFTDDGRAWKAGETVSFTENTNLYTIECTKISDHTEYGNASGQGNYILMNDIDLTKGGGKLKGDNCTTRVFMNGKTITAGNGDRPLFGGNSQSFYLLGQGTVNSAWGGGVYRGHCKISSANVVWFFGKDVTVYSNKDGSAFITIWNHIGVSSLNIHVYGTILKSPSGVVGTWSFLSSDTNATDYDIYFHEGATVEVTGRLVNYNNTGSTAGFGSITIDGANVILPYESYFYNNKSSATFDGALTINAGTFNIANADTLAGFKSSIVSDKKALDIDATSFKVICKECAFEKTFGDDFVGLTSAFTIKNYCPKCKTSGESIAVEPIFKAKGYALSPNGTAIDGGYSVNLKSLKLYEEMMGKVEYGIVIANAETFGGASFFNAQNKVNSAKAIQVRIGDQFANFGCSINFGATSNDSLKLVICAYAIDDGGVTFIQHETGDTVDSSKITGGTFKSITLDMIVAKMNAVVPTIKEDIA